MPFKKRVLFLCTGNSCRSQMAEGLANELCRDVLEAYSAGTKPQSLNPHAVKVMAELGINISGNQPKSIDAFADKEIDFVVTVCDDAHEHCPYWPGRGKVMHRGFDDPPRLAESAATEAEALSHYRRVRDEIKDFIETLPEALKS